MLSWRGLAILVSFLLLFVEAFDPDLKTPLDQYANANCGGVGDYYDYYYYDDDEDKGNFQYLDKYIDQFGQMHYIMAREGNVCLPNLALVICFRGS